MHSQVLLAGRREGVVAHAADMVGLVLVRVHGVVSHVASASVAGRDDFEVVPSPEVALAVALAQLRACISLEGDGRVVVVLCVCVCVCMCV